MFSFDPLRKFRSRNESGSSSSQPTTGTTQPTSVSSIDPKSKERFKEKDLSIAEEFEEIEVEGPADIHVESGSKRKASLTTETEDQPPPKKLAESFGDPPRLPVDTQARRAMKRNQRKSKKTKHKGSPNDPTERKYLDVEDLDVERSYVDDIAPVSQAPNPERPKSWKHPGDEPLTDPDRLPKGWTPLEPDLDPYDLDAQIQRCHERLEDNIMPHIFKDRLKGLMKQKDEELELMEGRPAGLDLQVYKRLDILEKIRKHNEEKDDYINQLANIEALVKVYESGELKLTGLATYWSNGRQLCQPRPFDWDECEAFQRKHGTCQGFWVEYENIGAADMQLPSLTARASPIMNGIPTMPVALRLPGRTMWNELKFVFDTGASFMSIWSNDVDTLATPVKGLPNEIINPLVIGQRIQTVATGVQYTFDLIEVEVTLLDYKGRRMCPWERIPTIVQNGTYVAGRNERLDGPWTRSRFYAASLPDNSFAVHFAPDITSLPLKRIDPSKIPAFNWPTYPCFTPVPFNLAPRPPAVAPKASPVAASVRKMDKFKRKAREMLP